MHWPLVTGDKRCRFTALPPADSPNNVMRSGSPPNAFALSFNQRIAKAWSHIPTLPNWQHRLSNHSLVEKRSDWTSEYTHLVLHLQGRVIMAPNTKTQKLRFDTALMPQWRCQQPQVFLHCKCQVSMIRS